MRDTHGSARRRVASTAGPIQWVVVALLAAGVLLAVLERDVGPWLVALAGGLATLVAMAGLIVSRSTERAGSAFAERVHDGWAAVQTELTRSRRHDRKFALVGIPDDVWASGLAAPEDKAQLGFDVAESVQALVRRPDHAWADSTLLHLLLTDCDRRQALAFMARAAIAMPDLFGDERVKLVIFPDDGITLGALVARLHDGAPEPLRRVARQ